MISKEYRKVISILLHLNGEQLSFISPRTAHWFLNRMNICFISCRTELLYIINAYHDQAYQSGLSLRIYCSFKFEWNDPLSDALSTSIQRWNLFIPVSPLAAQRLARSACIAQTLFIGSAHADLFYLAEAKSHVTGFILLQENGWCQQPHTMSGLLSSFPPVCTPLN